MRGLGTAAECSGWAGAAWEALMGAGGAMLAVSGLLEPVNTCGWRMGNPCTKDVF